MSYDLKGKNAVITGASQGLGLAIARAYVKAGAGVLLCARDAKTLDRVREQLTALAVSGQIVATEAADVSRSADVERVVAKALKTFPRLHVLVNNAGVYGPKGPIEEVNWEEWVQTIEINLLGSVQMCRGLLPHFKKHRYGKIVQLSGGGATSPLPRLSAYAASKAGIVRFAETLAGEVIDYQIDVNAIAPGALNTRLLDEILAAGPKKVGKSFYQSSLKQKKQGGTPLETGAELAVFLGSSASDGITGKLISAVWDPWQKLPGYLRDLKETDVYTLRRIVPKERNLSWDND